ncbi:hypothetical protein WT81_27685 [Burkholderia stagnalis]|uniref:hypothetical protein n=1 Tax=Burkholderia stagnalis TaxID=1503054 RepID=UPI00076C15DD|nr:hypothetical protein [Burkholderia stagnalis]KWK51548.1 hypothetical protein WT81_27685 [Burkholderia stagnalis]
MLKVFVNDYFLGKARDLADADALAVGYAMWLVSAGRFDSGVLPFHYSEHGTVVVSGDIACEDLACADSVNGA